MNPDEFLAAELAQPYAAGLIELDLGGRTFRYLDRGQAQALGRRLLELAGDEDVSPTKIITAAECNRAYVEAADSAAEEQ